jgi:hypothetical protein
MSKLFYKIVFYALFALVFQNSFNILASTTKLKIEQIKINNNIVYWISSVNWNQMKYEKIGPDGLPVNLELYDYSGKISFRFNKSKNEDIKYRYKLDGQDTIWKYSDNSDWINFDNLIDSKYCFVLQEIENNKVTQVIKFNFFNRLNNYLIWNDFINSMLTFFFIWRIIKMK